MELGIPGIEDAEQVGAGGAAVVYAARQPEFGRRVAVKVFAADEDPRRVERERQAAGALSDHEGVVPVHGSGVTADGRPYLLMTYMPGGSLADRVRDRGPFGAARTAELGIRLADAVSEAHRRGIRHRDIKPQNVLFDADDRPRLADFGIADLGQQSFRTTDGTVSGTVSYMAPEVIRGHDSGGAADLYSLGASLYFTVEGRHLVTARPGESYEALVYRRVSAPEPVTFTGRTPPWLRRVLLQALQAEPGQRHRSVDDFAAALRTAGGSAIRIGPTLRRPPAREGHSPRRRPTPWTAPDAGKAGVAHRRPVLTVPGRLPPAGTPTPAAGLVLAGGPRKAALVLGGVLALVVVLVAGGLLAGRRPEPTLSRSATAQPTAAAPAAGSTTTSTAAAAPAALLPDPTWKKVDPGTAVADLSAIRTASGQADPSSGMVAFHLWGPDVDAERTVAWLARPGQQQIGVLFRMVDGRLRRSELPDELNPAAAAQDRVFRLSSVRFDLLPSLARQARQACRPQAPRNDVYLIAVALRDPRFAQPVVTVQLLDPGTGRLAGLDFTADGRRTNPDQPCRFS